nr:MAG TPA: hypothetical protein [Bacteriophage sp.]
MHKLYPPSVIVSFPLKLVKTSLLWYDFIRGGFYE